MGADWAIQPVVRSQQHEAPTNIQSRISEGSLTGQRTHTHCGQEWKLSCYAAGGLHPSQCRLTHRAMGAPGVPPQFVSRLFGLSIARPPSQSRLLPDALSGVFGEHCQRDLVAVERSCCSGVRL
jgi:hypothetical protein